MSQSHQDTVIGQRLVVAFGDALNEKHVANVGLDGLGERIVRGLDEARRRWPEVILEPESIGRYLAGRIPEDTPAAEHLDAVDLPELMLACAAGHGDNTAQRCFEESYFSELRVGLSRLRPSEDTLDEVTQHVRTTLFLASADGPARILEYAGRGSLRGLLRVMALRRGLDLHRAQKSPVAYDEQQWLAMPDEDAGPDLRAIKAQHRQAFRSALEAAARTLEPRQRNLLRLHLLDQVTGAQLARTYQVDRATITRWLARARGALFSATRAELQRRLGLSVEDFDSFVVVIESHFDASVRRLLKTQLE